MAKKCCLDDGRRACAYIRTEDPEHPWNPICILHVLQFLATKEDSTEIHIRMMKGVSQAPKTNPEESHQWERMYLVGVEGNWRCEKCGLTIHGGMWAPSDTAWGGCAGKQVHWQDYKYECEPQ